MFRNSALGVACALAIVVCSGPNAAGDSSKIPAETRAPATSAQATASIKVRGVTISFDHFGVAEPVMATLMSLTGVVAQISSQSVASNGASDSGGLSVIFSGDPACHYADGAVFQLKDPCIFLSESSSLPEDPRSPVVSVVNMCQPKIGGDGVTGLLLANGCLTANGPLNGPIVTTGTLTLRHWSPSGPIDFSFSAGAQLTGIFIRPVVLTNPVRTYDTFAVPISGAVSAK
jgi:hypothetical protein